MGEAGKRYTVAPTTTHAAPGDIGGITELKTGIVPKNAIIITPHDSSVNSISSGTQFNSKPYLQEGGYITIMNKNLAIKITLLLLLIAGLAAALGCGDVVRGGAKVVLEGVTLGTMSMEGKPVQGLPSQKVNILLKVATNEVRINTEGGKTTLKLNPSGAIVVIGPEGTSFTGTKSDEVEIQWQTTEPAQ